ncbi:MAG TPA: GNAT family N-acetyltransferase [Gemmatimonadales bacterium]|nr:GNAT family N-acetyltransferase [Gemmatimonadales bacterium]
MNTPLDILIRRAGAADAEVLARLRYDFRAAEDPVIEQEAEFLARCTGWMAERLDADRRWRCWMAEHLGSPVGTIWLQLIEKLPNPVAEPELHGYISSLYVEPSRRGTGVGSRLLETCLRTCEEECVDAVLLWPTARSRALYARHGFAIRDDVMEKRLR